MRNTNNIALQAEHLLLLSDTSNVIFQGHICLRSCMLYNNLESYDNLEFQAVVHNIEIDMFAECKSKEYFPVFIENIRHNTFAS